MPATAAGAGAAACPDAPATAPLAEATALPQPEQNPAPSGTEAPQFAQKAIIHSGLRPRASKTRPACVLGRRLAALGELQQSISAHTILLRVCGSKPQWHTVV